MRLLCTAGCFPINYVGVTSSQTWIVILSCGQHRPWLVTHSGADMSRSGDIIPGSCTHWYCPRRIKRRDKLADLNLSKLNIPTSHHSCLCPSRAVKTLLPYPFILLQETVSPSLHFSLHTLTAIVPLGSRLVCRGWDDNLNVDIKMLCINIDTAPTSHVLLWMLAVLTIHWLEPIQFVFT